MIIPIPPAVNKKRSIWSSVNFRRSLRANKIPGRVPEEPAVGVAQITPMAALTSLVAIAPSTAAIMASPDRVRCVWRYSLTFTA